MVKMHQKNRLSIAGLFYEITNNQNEEDVVKNLNARARRVKSLLQK